MSFKEYRDGSLEANHEVWRTASPDGYARASELRGQGIAKILKQWGIARDGTVVELGCNCGRNLAALYDAGYRWIRGVEINPLAVEKYTQIHGNYEPHIQIFNASLEDWLPTARDNEYDAVFTMAVLMHIHPDSEWIFEHIARITGNLLVTIEKEGWHGPPRAFARNYKEIFEKFGMKQVEERDGFADPPMGAYKVRIFKKVSNG